MSDFPAEYSATLANYDGKIETCKLWEECQAIVDWLLIDCESPRSEAEVVTAFLSWPIASKRIFMSVLGDEEYQVKSDELKNAINQNILDENQYVASTAQMCSFSCCSPVFTMKIGTKVSEIKRLLVCNSCGHRSGEWGLIGPNHKAGDQCPCCYLDDYDCDGTLYAESAEDSLDYLIDKIKTRSNEEKFDALVAAGIIDLDGGYLAKK